ncbi:MAG TPA: hypothetical protein DCL13_03075 [Peptococcaceae bacterium]|nr:hypothetical protein [Peptococcaceae bacterium]
MHFFRRQEIVERKYTAIRYNWPHLVRSLGYFADAEEDPMPVLVVAGVKREMSSSVDNFAKCRPTASRFLRRIVVMV